MTRASSQHGQVATSLLMEWSGCAPALPVTNLARDSNHKALDWLCEDLAEALRRLLRIADGDYSADKYAERFPKFDRPIHCCRAACIRQHLT